MCYFAGVTGCKLDFIASSAIYKECCIVLGIVVYRVVPVADANSRHKDT